MAICGHCKAEGVDVAHIRACSQGGSVKTRPFSGPIETPEDPWLEEAESSYPDDPEKDFDLPGISFEHKDRAKDEIRALGLRPKWDGFNKKWTVRCRESQFEAIPSVWRDAPEDHYDVVEELTDGIYAYNTIDEGSDDFTYYMVYHTVYGANQQVAKELVLEGDDVVMAERRRDVLGNAIFSEGGDEHVGEWVYRGKAPLGKLCIPEDDYGNTSRLLEGEEAAKFGQVYGWCGRCGRILTKEESKRAGIGPVCAGKE